MNLLATFQENINKQALIAREQKLLLAVSGGVDSVVMCELCFRSGYDFVIAHCNFQLRGSESMRDEEFVQSLQALYQKPVRVKRFDTAGYAEAKKISVQLAARELRYQWFEELMGDTGDKPSVLLTAHHADDNVETMLMNFFKGTGIAGLRGILPRQGRMIRPMLEFRKADLLEFATSQHLHWVEDSSNTTDKYSRNFFRQHIIPLVQKIYPQAEENLLDNVQRFAEAEQLYRQAIALHKKKLVEKKGQELHIPVLKLQQSQPLRTLVFEIVQEYGFTPKQVEEIIRLLHSESGRYVQSPTHQVIRNRKWLIIAPLRSETPGMLLVEKSTDTVRLPGKTLAFDHYPADGSLQPTADPSHALLDAGDIQYPLILRRAKAGDYFYPLGMRKKKKVARFLIDQKLSKTEKENVWVLESNHRILWVLGYRIDDRFRLTSSTKHVLSITSR